MFCLEFGFVVKEWKVVEITTRRTDEESEEEAQCSWLVEIWLAENMVTYVYFMEIMLIFYI